MNNSGVRYFFFLVWVSSIYIAAILLFTQGFFLRRLVVKEYSNCSSKDEGLNCFGVSIKGQFKKAIVLIVDGLRYDFATFNPNLKNPLPYQNQLPILNKLAQETENGRLYKFMADPPTTTMQRLKGLTTGTLPTFIDLSKNFASPEIEEDNLIYQLQQYKRKVVFMGDDTWTSIFSEDKFLRFYPFPSFNVWDLDTVDNGILDVIFDELNKTDWDVLIAHFLGIDHVGHLYGPNHGEMTRKLHQMNDVIEKVSKTLTNDTILFVLSDHGMTVTGDHGGDSELELESVLFAYSPSLNFECAGKDEDVISQIDFVPTFSLLLGMPIPFSNIGMIVTDLFFASSTCLKTNFIGQNVINSLKINCEQVMNYLEVYSQHGGKFHRNKFEALEDLAYEIHRKTLNSIEEEHEVFFNRTRLFLQKSKNMCKEEWIDFSLPAMWAGLNMVCILTGLLSLVLLIPKSKLLATILSGDILFSVYFSTFTGLLCAILFHLLGIGIDLNVLLLFLSSGFGLMHFGFNVLWKLRMSLLFMFRNSFKVSYQDSLTSFILFVSFCGLSSNSFVINESHITMSLSITCVLSYFVNFFVGAQFKKDCVSKNFLKKYYVQIMLILVACLLIRLSSAFFPCREELINCVESNLTKPITASTVEGVQNARRSWRFLGTVISYLLVTFLPFYWLQYCGNLNGFSLNVLLARYSPFALAFLFVSYWLVFALPLNFQSNLHSWQKNILAQLGYILSTLCILAYLKDPVFIFEKKKLMPSFNYDRSRGLSSIIHHISHNYEKYANSEKENKKIPIVYGLGTSHSAALLIFLNLICLLTMVSLGDGLSPPVFILFITFILVCSLSSFAKFDINNCIEDVMTVSWSTVITLGFLSCNFFYATGHQTVFSAIQWNSGFVGFMDTMFSNNIFFLYILPAFMIWFNTFCSQITFSLFLPLLLIMPFTIYIMFPNIFHSQRSAEPQSLEKSANINFDIQDVINRGEFIFLSKSEGVKANCLLLISKYILFHAVRLFGTMFCATIHRRHLMVWKIFAPRFIFEAVSFITIVISVIVGFLLFVLIHNKILNWYLNLSEKKK